MSRSEPWATSTVAGRDETLLAVWPLLARRGAPASYTAVVAHASDLLTVALLVGLEGLLSADNAMVLALLVLGLPRREQRQALHYGIVGAFAFRSGATVLAVYLIRLGWVKLVGASYLMYLAVQHFTQSGGAEARRAVAPAHGQFGLSPFWTTVVKVELTDIVFALDSILVGVAMSPKLWVILSGGILGIVMMRLIIAQLLAIIERYPPLVDGAFIIIAWVAIRLLIEFLHAAGLIGFEISNPVSLGLILVIFLGTYLYARRKERLSGDPVAHAAETLFDQGRADE
jgi:YkoY family integral membrane protein